MYTPRPILWFNADRVSPEDVPRLAESYPGAFLLPVLGDSPNPPCGFVMERWPTPDELFRWHSRPRLVVMRGFWRKRHEVSE